MSDELDWVSSSHWLMPASELRRMSISEFTKFMGLEDAGLKMTVRWPD